MTTQSQPKLDSLPAPANGTEPLRWIVAQEGSRQTYAIPLAFNRLGVLRLFYADIWCRHGRSLLRRFSSGGRALAGRYRSEIPRDRVVSFNLGATVFQTIRHFRRGRQTAAELGEAHCRFGQWYGRQVRNHLRNVKLDPARDSFFGFDTNSLEVLEMLKERRIFTILDQVDPGIVHENMVIEETKLWPGWQKFPDRMPQSYWDRRQVEWELADLVLVNSEWSRQAVIKQGVPAEKIVVVPLAIDLAADHLLKPVNAEGTLKVLWLGNVLVSKGIQYLVEAARLLKDEDIEFLLAGPVGIEEKVVRDFPPKIKLLGRVTRDQLSNVYRQAHVFVLPTISDGFAVTQLEALAHGLPVVITPNCGRVVTDGKDGFVVPARDGRALADALSRLNNDRELVSRMSTCALETIQYYDLPSNARLISEIASRERNRLGF
jgi:glycosyltransferase involved in cell wall biosynthesis